MKSHLRCLVYALILEHTPGVIKRFSLMKIVFTGGGTAGHVTKNKIVIEALKESHPEVEAHYVGLATGKEAELIDESLAPFHPISSGKLRRYFSLKTVPDFFRFLRGIAQSYRLLGKIQPKLVFSSGGYVALPVALAAYLRKIPIVTHETDSYPGLANRMIGRVADKIFLGFESAQSHFDLQKVHFTGNPVSPALFEGSRERALEKLGFRPERKTLLVMGGSQGAQQINELIWEILPEVIEEGWQVVHLTGRGKGRDTNARNPGVEHFYRPFEYVKDDYEDFLNAADLVISRAGGNSLAEIAALNKPAVLIPLPLPAAAGDHQRKNALEMAKRRSDWCILENPSAQELLETIRLLAVLENGRKRDESEHLQSQQRIVELLSELW